MVFLAHHSNYWSSIFVKIFIREISIWVVVRAFSLRFRCCGVSSLTLTCDNFKGELNPLQHNQLSMHIEHCTNYFKNCFLSQNDEFFFLSKARLSSATLCNNLNPN
jgi:hypothetical protein